MKTTEPKAKAIRGMIDQMITLAKTGSLHARRQAMSFILDKRVTDKLFAELGGYDQFLSRFVLFVIH